MKKRIHWLLTAFAVLTAIISSCSKEPGEGGNASIYGKVYVKNYNSSFTVLLEEYLAPEQDVYIVYGDDKSYSDRIRTNYDGVYEFKYLRPGKYSVYVYSDDSTLTVPSGTIVKIQDVEIKKKNEEVEVPLITILK